MSKWTHINRQKLDLKIHKIWIYFIYEIYQNYLVYCCILPVKQKTNRKNLFIFKNLMNLILFHRALPGPPNHIFTASFRTFDGRGDEKRGIFPSNHSLSPSTYYQPTTIVMFTIGCSLLLFLPISLPPTFVCPESNSPAHSLASLRNPECFSSCNNFY